MNDSSTLQKNGLQLGMIIGRSRIFGDARDMALETIEHVCKTCHRFKIVLAAKNDPIHGILRERNIPTAVLPDAFCAPLAKTRQFAMTPEYEAWENEIRTHNLDLGITFYSGWLPISLVAVPRLRFINIHPAPLPMLTGYEAEKFHVITDRRRSWGVIHRLEEHFDTGNILTEGLPVNLPEDMTPMDVYEGLIGGCIPKLLELLDQFAAGDTPSEKNQDESQRTYASRKNAFQETVIRWHHDTHRQIDCRFRAFNTVEDEMILKAKIDDQLYSILDLMLDVGDFPGVPGQRIGRYHQNGLFDNTPIVRTLQGIAVLRLGQPITSHDQPVYLAPEDIKPRRAASKKVERNCLILDEN